MQNRKIVSIITLLLALFIVGCEKKIFMKTIDDSIAGAAPKTVFVVGEQTQIINLPRNPTADITIKIQKIKSSCSTERARSLGSDFDGYILIEVYKNGSLAAKAQMDFKTEPKESDFALVWLELAKKLGWNTNYSKHTKQNN